MFTLIFLMEILYTYMVQSSVVLALITICSKIILPIIMYQVSDIEFLLLKITQSERYTSFTSSASSDQNWRDFTLCGIKLKN